MRIGKYTPGEVRKAVVAVVTCVATVAGIAFSNDFSQWVEPAIAAITGLIGAFCVYELPNDAPTKEG